MGNCLSHKDNKIIKVMKIDGEVLKFKSPMKVCQLLSRFPGHAISDKLPVVQYLDPGEDMISGQLYYLLPPPRLHVDTSSVDGVVRVKLVLRKQELREMLSNKGLSLDSMLSHLSTEVRSHDDDHGREEETCFGWKPSLESIPEGNDLCS